MLAYTIYVGLNDKDTKEQKYSTGFVKRLVSVYLQEHFEGSTLTEGSGLYKHDNGTKVNENTLIISLLDVAEDSVKTLCNQLKKMLNQESVMVQKTNVELSFI